MAGKIKMADIPVIEPKGHSTRRDPGVPIIGRYDDEDDAFTIHYNKSAIGGTLIRQTGGFWIIVDPKTNEIVGMHIEGWIRNYVSKVPALFTLWEEVKTQEIDPETLLPKNTVKPNDDKAAEWYQDAKRVLASLLGEPRADGPSHRLVHA